MPRRLLILGSTGSIGTQALDIVERSRDIELVGLSAERSWETLIAQARAHGVTRIALADADAGARAAEAWTDGEVLTGPEGLMQLVIESGAELVLNALVGSVGLGPTVATLGEGIDLALANKESLVARRARDALAADTSDSLLASAVDPLAERRDRRPEAGRADQRVSTRSAPDSTRAARAPRDR